MSDYENFFEWFYEAVITTAQFNAIFCILVFVILGLIALKLFVSLIAQIRDLFK